MSLYVLDSDTFIQAHRSHYPIDVFPNFWEKLKQLASENKIISIDKVKNEIYENEDVLKDWIQINLDDNIFHTTQTQEVLSEYRKVVNWANSKSSQYMPNAINEFLDNDNADAWLIAFCLYNGHTIVTQEIGAPYSKSKIKIPDVCNAFNVRHINTISLFRELLIKI